MNNPRCLICLAPLSQSERDYHAACCRELFGSDQPPTLPYTWEQLNALAEKTVRRMITVPGVQPKLSMHLEKREENSQDRFTLVGLEGGYILKPPVKAYPEMPELEHLTMRMAGCFDIATPACGLVQLKDGPWAYVTRRMDQEPGNRRHMEDMCQLTGRLTEHKYRGSMEQVSRTVLRYCTNPGYDALRLFELNLFCFITGNNDMHLKNFSLIYRPEGDITLSPAYDLLPVVLLIPKDTEESALSMNGRKKKFTRKNFTEFGERLHLTEKQVENVYERFTGHLPSALDVLERGFCSGQMKIRYQELLAERTARLGIA